MATYENASAVREAERLIDDALQTGATTLSLRSLRIRRLPASITRLAGTLVSLDLSECGQLSDVSALSAVTGLQQLSLRGCASLSDLNVLVGLTGLQQLDLGRCASLIDPRVLSGLTGLQQLDLSWCVLLSDLGVLSDLSGLRQLDLQDCRSLSDLSVLAGLTGLRHLDLSACRSLRDLSVLTCLRSLQHLNLSWCGGLTDLNVLKGLTGLQHLSLIECESLSDLSPLMGMTDLRQLNVASCYSLSDLSLLPSLAGLQELTLSWCESVSDVSGLASLTGLQLLDLGGCGSLSDLSVLTGLTSLQQLNLSWCGWLGNLSVLGGLTGLKELDLGACESLTDISALEGLAGLEHLNLQGCASISDFGVLKSLTGLRRLDLSGCTLFSDVSVLGSLTGLQQLDLGECTLPSDLRVLTCLTGLKRLGLDGCTLPSDLSVLTTLRDLQSLSLSGCESLSDFSALEGLTNLQSLRLSGCGSLSDLSDLAGLTALQQLDARGRQGTPRAGICVAPQEGASFDWFVNGLPRLQDLHLERLAGCPEELQGYFCLPRIEAWISDLRDGACEHRAAKLLVLGNGRVGKTQIVRQLACEGFDAGIPSTHGIQTRPLTLSVEGVGEVTLHAWDFGGQDLYLGTHSMFVDSRAVCLLVWSTATENEFTVADGELTDRNRLLPYWTGFIQAMAGPEVPLIVAQSRCESELQRREPNLPTPHGFTRLQVSHCCAEPRRMNRLLMDLQDAVRYQHERRRLAYLMPQSWLKVAAHLEALREQGNKTLDWEAYERLCRDESGVGAPRTLLHYLHESGAVFWRDGVFDQQIVLDQAWALEGVYALLHRQAVMPALRKARGHFSREWVQAALWDGRYTVAEQDMFIDMMKRCGICFEVGDGCFIAPDALPELEDVRPRADREWEQADADAAVRLDFAFLHDGVGRSVLSAIGEKAGPDAVYWRYGCCVRDGRTGVRLRVSTAMPTDPGQDPVGSIRVETAGPGSARLAKHLVNSVTELMPFGQKPAVYWERGGEPITKLSHGSTALSPDDANPGDTQAFAEVPRARPATAATSNRPVLYVSYAWGGDSGKAVDQLGDLIGQEDIEFIRDRTHMQSGDSIRRFEQEIGRAPFVLVVLSEKYLRSSDCMRELSYFYQHARAERARFTDRVIPVVLDGVQIDQAEQRFDYLDFWEGRQQTLEALVAKYGPAKAGVSTTQELQDIAAFEHCLVDALYWMADTVMPRGYETLSAQNFEPVLDLVRRRVRPALDGLNP